MPNPKAVPTLTLLVKQFPTLFRDGQACGGCKAEKDLPAEDIISIH